jgi:hypothetical protein
VAVFRILTQVASSYTDAPGAHRDIRTIVTRIEV